MPRLVPIPAKKLLKILCAHGYTVLRVAGSHHFLYNAATEKTATIPIHGNEELGQGLLRKILRDIDMSLDEFEKIRTS